MRKNVRKKAGEKNLHKFRRVCIALAIVLALGMFSPISAHAQEKQAPLLRAVTYVSDAWVVDFWNTESDHMEEELAQIAADGFNSIILVIPWREFQPNMVPVTYNNYAFDKLNRVMEAARAQGLWVQVRVGYTWDYYAEGSSQLRFRQMLWDEQVQKAWVDYVKTLYHVLSSYSNFYGGFITWEDFWNYIEDAPYMFRTQAASIKEAKQIGFQDFLKEHYSLEEVNDYFGPATPFTDYDSIAIPDRDSPAYKLFFEFYDCYLIGLLERSQQVFPGLSMEVRLDVDPVKGPNGSDIGAIHYQTFPCGESDYTSLMYSVSMGYGANRLLTAPEAISMMKEQLDLVKAYNGGKPVFIDQLLYMDETPGFEHNARLYPEERNAYLVGLPDILKQYTNGYAVWTYRNYANNLLYNSQFALGDRGWRVVNGRVEEREGSRQMKLYSHGSLEQSFAYRNIGRIGDDTHVRFIAESQRPVTISVSVGEKKMNVQVQGRQQFDLDFGKQEYTQVVFSTDGEVYLDNLYVYDFVQDGQLYSMDNDELGCLAGVQTLNQELLHNFS